LALIEIGDCKIESQLHRRIEYFLRGLIASDLVLPYNKDELLLDFLLIYMLFLAIINLRILQLWFSTK